VFTERFKSVMGRIGYALSVTLLIAYLALVGVSFLIAAHDQMIPTKWWDSEGGNHGPWRYYQPVRSLHTYSLMVLLAAIFASGITGGFLGRAKQGGIMMLASLGLLILDFVFLFWLVD